MAGAPRPQVHVAVVFASLAPMPEGSERFVLSLGLFPHYADPESRAGPTEGVLSGRSDGMGSSDTPRLG